MALLDKIIFNLDGQVAVVTGAASGFGRIFSYALAEVGADVVLIKINVTGLEDTATRVRSIGR